ncbi:protein-serine O-palmitoleoyltransferase porcupine-like [Bolinopsis microptera]|uniref:protein-serine O-palmitoleoyltransferase porcupine-like n=1 Tax=Bolinopsis microptera TaxID=2820187 RepID=UPI00307A5341
MEADDNEYYHDNAYYEDSYNDDSYHDNVLESTLHYCVLPVVGQVTAVFLKIFGLAAIVSILNQLQWEKLTFILDTLLGILCAFLFYQSSTLFIVFLVVISYAVLIFSSSSGKCGAAILLINLAFVFICELLVVAPEQWHQIRGTIILLLMKTTSVGFDIDAGVVDPPSLLLFSGYSLSPVSLVFGPFVTLPDYKKSKLAIFERQVLISICSSLFLAYLSVLVSSCILPTFIDPSSHTLIRTYLTALSFRTSHYFVSYTSQASALIGGFQHSEKYYVVQPSRVEIPRSMSSVAVAWNIPMHYWLKTYVYKKSRSYGVFVAAFLTYAASSVLHGLNSQLPAVLISIFIFSYVEAVLREELSILVSSCIRVQKCVDCQHNNKVFELPLRVAFVIVNILQLAYLGVMFDSDPSQTEGYSWLNTVLKWQNLYWYGHVMCATGFLFTLLLRLLNKKLNRTKQE